MDNLGSYSERAKRITDDMMQESAGSALSMAWCFGFVLVGFVIFVAGLV